MHTRTAPSVWVQGYTGRHRFAVDAPTQVAYLEPMQVKRPLAVRQVLRDAHARLGGAACGAKQALFRTACRSFMPVELDGDGRVMDDSVSVVEFSAALMLRHARMASESVVVFCRDLEELRRAGLEPGAWKVSQCELRVWWLEGLAWQQWKQGQEEVGGGRVRWERRGGGRWERRGASGRRGRRRREPGVVFELGPWGEERRALPHWEVA